ncbi:MAG: gamma-glutamyltransferase [Dehalococcoidia bacterium]
MTSHVKIKVQSPHGVVAPAYRPTVMGLRGAVASGHPMASQAGLRILQEGGNAVDAAIATAAALNVVEPHMSGIGGDGFILIYMAQGNELRFVNATGPAPLAARREAFKDGIPYKGILSVSVPGLLDGWLLAHQRYGALKLERVLAPAMELAEEGFPVTPKLAEYIAAEDPPFASIPTSAAIFTRDGRPLAAGEVLVQRGLARTLRLIAVEGRDAFYDGPIGQAIVRFRQETGGLLSDEDFRRYHARWDEPISTTYRGYTVYESPPNSSGVTLLQELNIVENFDLAALGCDTPETSHVMVEAKRLAFADRERYLADPDFLEAPLAGLLSKEYAAQRARQIDLGHALADVGPGRPETGEDTTYFCVVDRWGNAVSQIQSLQMAFGSGLVAGDTGIVLNNRMTYWHLDEGHPDRLEPGKRVRHTMNTPMVFKGGRLFLVFGTPGADTQVQTNLQVLTHILDFGYGPQEAVEAPRWRHIQRGMESTYPHGLADELHMEGRFPQATREALRAKGHNVVTLPDWGGMGHAQAIMVDPQSGALAAASDPRRDGYAVAW